MQMATPQRGNIYGKKRAGGSLLSNPRKRVFSLSNATQNGNSSPRRAISNAPGPEKGGSTGLEGIIDFNQPFVEATKVTYEDENKAKAAIFAPKDYTMVIQEKEELVSNVHSCFNALLIDGRLLILTMTYHIWLAFRNLASIILLELSAIDIRSYRLLCIPRSSFTGSQTTINQVTVSVIPIL